MSRKFIARLIEVLGAILLLVSLAANPLRIGTNPDEFGWLQMLGSFLGAVILAGGMWLSIREG